MTAPAIPLSKEERAEIRLAKLIDRANLTIDQAYVKLEALPGFIPRKEQVDLSRSIAASFLSGVPYAAEAPTGTGKTVAYLIGALAAARLFKEKGIVVSTASVVLQEQILKKDLPDLLVRAGIIEDGAYQVAKGRSRYFCIAQAEGVVNNSVTSGQEDLFDEDATASHKRLKGVQPLLERWNGGGWDGDKDSLPGAPPRMWMAVASSKETCTGKQCEHYSSCPFFKARNKLANVELVIANHDFTLIDLQLKAIEGLDPLIPYKSYFVVFDEAHHLPEKAVNRAAAEADLTGALGWIKRASDLGAKAMRIGPVARLMQQEGLEEDGFSAKPAMQQLNGLIVALDEEEVNDSGFRRYKSGLMPSLIAGLATSTGHKVSELTATVKMLVTVLRKKTKPTDKQDVAREALLFQESAKLLSKLETLEQGLLAFTGEHRAVRWLARQRGAIRLNTSPTTGAAFLTQVLWKQSNVAPVFVSATLKGTGSFEPFLSLTAMKSFKYDTCVFPYVLPYHNSKLTIAKMKYDPPQTKEYIAELVRILPGYISTDEGTLLLFSSKAILEAVVSKLKPVFPPGFILSQEAVSSMDGLIAEHKRRIDAGKGSVIAGLQKFGEGVDLPGSYCSHVAICRLPFSVPTHPVEEELREDLGWRYFSDHAVPKAMVKLVQMVGRLVRTNTDAGRVTVFDNRLSLARYGLAMWNALPPLEGVRQQSALPSAPQIAEAAAISAQTGEVPCVRTRTCALLLEQWIKDNKR